MTTSVVPRLSGKVVEHPTQFRAKQGRQDINVLTVIRNISSLGSSLLVKRDEYDVSHHYCDRCDSTP